MLLWLVSKSVVQCLTMLSLLAGYHNTCKPLSRCAIYSKLSTIPDLWKPSGDDIRGNGHVQAYHVNPNRYPQKSTFCGYFLDPDFTADIAGDLVDRANVQGKVQQGYQHWQSSTFPPKDQSSWLLISEPLFFINQAAQKEYSYVGYLDYAKPGQVRRRYYQSRLALALTEVGTFSVFPFGKGRTDPGDGLPPEMCDFPFCSKLPWWFPIETLVNPSPNPPPAPAPTPFWPQSTGVMGRGGVGNTQGRGRGIMPSQGAAGMRGGMGRGGVGNT